MRQVDVNFSPTISSNNPDQTNLIEDFALAKMDLASVHFVELPIQGLRSRQVKSEQCVDRKSTRLNSSHSGESRMPSSA